MLLIGHRASRGCHDSIRSDRWRRTHRIADAADLAARLLAGDVTGYSAARHAEGAHVLALSERARRVLQSTNPLGRILFLNAKRLANAVPPLGRAVMRQLAKA